MKKTSVRFVQTALLALAVGFHTPLVRAELVTTPEAASQESADAERAKVQHFLEQATVKDRLQAMGVGGVFAAQRVAALDQQEIHALAQRIDAMPAGGNITTTEWILIVLVAILIVILV
ncbi:PA2779 family protein [Dechloromonas sp. XY25]|uniref:PA2779 family protein n=1 Tax=Dechloromonas hankyongensis TaxID=2908002 RepID=A0ABS9K188_9RHOO|nr:PA2779 family protein [Dechloromonas hankyongensis]MCG2576864.1 PA2779 family protein [Dechloromonas hankyongensis]